MADWCLHGSLWYHGVAAYLACAITAGALLPYRRWGAVFVPTTAIPSLGDGICAYRCHTIVGGRYLCLLLPHHRGEMVYVLLHCCTDPGGLYLCLLAA